jgi:hypothetical protein
MHLSHLHIYIWVEQMSKTYTAYTYQRGPQYDSNKKDRFEWKKIATTYFRDWKVPHLW